jgi:hypothetical protein
VNLLFITDPSKTEFNNTVDEILRRPEYDGLRRDVTNYIDKFKEWLQELLTDLLEGLFSKVSIGSGFSTVLVIIALLIFTVLIIFIIVKIGKSFERRKRVKEILGEKIDDNTTPSTLKTKAAAFAEVGDIRQAIRFGFIALLLLMHERNVVYLDETRTNEEIYRYLARKKFDSLLQLRGCINIFNLVWYGHKIGTKDMYEEWNQNVTALWNEVNIYETKDK